MKLLCFLSLGSIAVFYIAYDGSEWMNNFYFISDKIQMSILLCFLTLNKDKVVSFIAKYLYYISLIRLFYSLIMSFGVFTEDTLKLDCIALFFVTIIVSLYEWNTKRL
jgi:hypothetical protein